MEIKYDGRGYNPPYISQIEEAEIAERERCAQIAESLEFRLEVKQWIDLSKKQISAKIAKAIAEAIRLQ